MSAGEAGLIHEGGTHRKSTLIRYIRHKRENRKNLLAARSFHHDTCGKRRWCNLPGREASLKVSRSVAVE